MIKLFFLISLVFTGKKYKLTHKHKMNLKHKHRLHEDDGHYEKMTKTET